MLDMEQLTEERGELEGGRHRKGNDKEALRMEAGIEAKKEAGRFSQTGPQVPKRVGRQRDKETETYRQIDADKE